MWWCLGEVDSAREGDGGRRRRAATPLAACHTGALAGARGVRRRSQGGGVSAQPVGVRAVWSGARRVAGQVATPAARRRRRERETEEKGDGGEGNFVIKAKFKISFCKLNFSPYSKGQVKNF